MPVYLKPNEFHVKDESTGNYLDINAVAEQSTAQTVAAVTAEGTTQIDRINTRATEVSASLPKSGEMEDMVAVPFVQATAYPAGKYVIQEVSGVNHLYYLPNGHEANVTWENTTKVGPLNLGDETSSLKSAFTEKKLDKSYYTNSGWNNSGAIAGQNTFIIDVAVYSKCHIKAGYVPNYFNLYTLLDSTYTPVRWLRNESGGTSTTFEGDVDVHDISFVALTVHDIDTDADNVWVSVPFPKGVIDSETYYNELPIEETKNGYYQGGSFVTDQFQKQALFDVKDYEWVLASSKASAYTNLFTCLKNGNVVRYYYPNVSAIKYIKGLMVYVGDCDTIALKKDNEYPIIKAEIQTIGMQELYPIKFGTGFYSNGSISFDQTSIYGLYDVSETDTVFISGSISPWKDEYTLFDKDMRTLSYVRNETGARLDFSVTVDTKQATYLQTEQTQNNIRVFGKTDKSLQIAQGNKETINRKWSGKKVVWYGTSIPAAGGFNNQNNYAAYPYKLSRILDFTVYNEAIGGSCVHCKSPDRVDASTNPYGFVNDFGLCSTCITNTQTEMQWVIDHFNSGVFTVNVPSSLSDATKANILNASYEVILNKYLSGGSIGQCDLYVFNYGWNDGSKTPEEDQSVIAQYGEDTLYCFTGAMNWLLKKVYSSNPHNKVCMIGEVRTRPICAAEEKIAENWNIPICKLRELLGWSSKVISTTGYWDNNYPYWHESGGEEQQLAVYQTWLKDGVHPHSDLSGRALWHVVVNLVPFFTDEIRFDK